MFLIKIRKLGIPLQIPVLLYKSGFKGVYFSGTCFPDVYGKLLVVLENCIILAELKFSILLFIFPHCMIGNCKSHL